MKTRILLLLVAVAMLAIPSYAQLQQRQLLQDTNETEGGGWYGTSSYDKGQYLDNPCTPYYDQVYVNYSAFVEGLQFEEGTNRYLLSESTTMGGGMYAASGSGEADVDYTRPVAVRQYHKVNTADAFHVVTVINFDPMAKSTWVSVETACGNGMPDSAQ